MGDVYMHIVSNYGRESYSQCISAATLICALLMSAKLLVIVYDEALKFQNHIFPAT